MPLKKLVPGTAKTTDDLIAQIENKDRRFRLAQTVFMIATLLALIIVIGAQQRTLDGVKDQLAQAKVTAAEQSKQSDDQRDKIIRRLDCIVVFFTQPDRAAVTIADIDKCALNRDGNVDQFFQQPEATPADQPPNLAPSAGSANPGTTPPATVNPQGPGLSPIIPQQPAPTPVTPPVEVLGIPVCVPFTGLCVR